MSTTFDPRTHWEDLYAKKGPQDVSWFQAMPKVSLDLFAEYGVRSDARIIDIGGGDSLLVDHLLDRGFTDLTVLDISGKAMEKAQNRLGDRANAVEWIEASATDFEATAPFDVWHDRAVFHFLTTDQEVEDYLGKLSKYLAPGGLLILATFSENGPEKCSGIPVHRYSEAEMTARLGKVCTKIKCITVDHETPTHKIQNFLFCAFRKPDAE
ncbi:MAG: class I SAM-dependent methyltransferase [Flavobacteriales bacterium]|jgi:trans-aconitate methyltransferase|nr:class I SAM-dependent methyltransferase [Flavobacteriales bacterium]